MFLLALIFLFFSFFSAQPAQADTLPTTACDAALIAAPHIMPNSTLEQGTTTFEYTGSGQPFATATSGVITLNFRTIFNASATSTFGAKLVGMRADCSLIGGFAANFDEPVFPADHVMTLVNTTVTLDGTPFNMRPQGSARYIWIEVGTPGGATTSYSYLIDVTDVQNPIPSAPPPPPPPPAPPPPPPFDQNNSGGGGAVSGATTPPKILRFESDKKIVKEGEAVLLSWETEGADYVTLDGIGLVAKTGSQGITATKTFTYNLTALGMGGETKASTVVEVLPRDPVVIVPGILGSAKDSAGNLTLDPILHTYDGLWEGLKSVGYVEGKNLFAFPYDWRKSNALSARLLGEKIDTILSICECQKVDVVAHSMGGLVTRYYVQNINKQTIDQLIFLGTPHLGAPKAYLAWEAGEMGNKASDALIELKISLEANHLGEKDVVKFIREQITSVQQLLPIFGYLSNETGRLYNYDECANEDRFSCNDFLESLNSDHLPAYDGLSVSNIVNDTFDTPRAFVIDENFDSSKLKKSYQWKRGMPKNYPKDDGIIYGSGDGTVPVNSAQLFKEAIVIDGEHTQLPYYSQSEISQILIGKKIINFGKGPIKRFLFIGIKSPADISVDCGCEYYYSGTEDPEYIVIPDPIDGEYKINVVGTGEGHFEVETSLIADDLEETKSYEGMIKPGEIYVLSTSVSATTTQDLIVISSPPREEGAGEVIAPEPESIASLAPIFAETSPASVIPAKILPSTRSGAGIQKVDEQILIVPTSTASTSSALSEEGKGEVLGITSDPKPYTPNPALYAMASLVILIAGYLTFKKQKV